jgi:hypothetical protein
MVREPGRGRALAAASIGVALPQGPLRALPAPAQAGVSKGPLRREARGSPMTDGSWTPPPAWL